MANDWRMTVQAVIDLQADEDMKTAPGPSLQWYPQQWLGDPAVQLMSMAARGCHHHLLMLAWKGFEIDPERAAVPCSLPDSPAALKALCHHPEGWVEIYTQVLVGWKDLDGRIWNLGLCRSYLQQMKTRRGKQKGGRARAAQQQESKSANAADDLANAEPESANAENGDSSSSPTPPSSPTAGFSPPEEEAAGAARPFLKLNPRDGGRPADLSFDGALLKAIPDFQERWTESRRKRRLSKKISIEVEQDQIDKFAEFCAEHGAPAALAVLEDANLGGYQKPIFKAPGDNGGRPSGPRGGSFPAAPGSSGKDRGIKI